MTEQRAKLLESIRLAAPLIIIAVGVVGFLILRRGTPPAQDPEKVVEAPLVDTAMVVKHVGDLTLATDGRVVPYREIVLSAEVSGRVTSKTEICRAGKSVRKGDLLLEIDARDYELAERQLQKQEDQAAANLKELQVEINNTQQLHELAKDDLKLKQDILNRRVQLRDRNANSQEDVDLANGNVLQARNAELMLKNQLELMQTRQTRLESEKELIGVQLDKARLDLSRCRIVSPVNGVVVEESVEADSYVQNGTNLLTIEDTSAVEVLCSLQTDELYWVWSQRSDDQREEFRKDYELPETPATVIYRLAGEQYAWDGVLWRYDGIGLDERTRTVPCRIMVPDPSEVRVISAVGEEKQRKLTGPPALVRGMFVSLKIHTQPDVSLMRMPFSAVRPGKNVWRVRDGVLKAVDVEIIEVADQDVVVRVVQEDQLQPTDQVVTSPIADAADGMRVRTRLTSDDQLAAASPAPQLSEEQ